jgi:hypothetical protein
MFSKFQLFAVRRPLVFAIGVFGLITTVVAACNRDRLLPTGAPRSVSTSLNQSAGRKVVGSTHRRPAEDRIVALANEIPGFAGMFLTPAHELVALVRDTTPQRAGSALATSALRAHVASDGFGLPTRDRPSTVRVLPADYDFQTLSNYRDFISDSLLGSNGVVSVNLDQPINRVTVGVLASGSTSQLTQIITGRGIPINAIHFVTSFGIRTAVGRSVASSRRRSFSTLHDDHPDTLTAGFKFLRPTIGSCTVGAVVDSAGSTRFVSASHCTANMFQHDGDSVTTYDGTGVGHETGDPAGVYVCSWLCWYHRGSDAAIFSLQGYVWPNGATRSGVIGRTSSRDSIGTGGTPNTSAVYPSS